MRRATNKNSGPSHFTSCPLLPRLRLLCTPDTLPIVCAATSSSKSSNRQFMSHGDNMIAAIIVVLITILFPPAGVLIVAGCGADLLINILLTLLGYFPGHIHAFWIEYVYYKRRGEAGHNVYDPPKTGIYSKKVQYPRGHAQHSTMDDTTHYAETPMAPALAPVAPAPGPVPMDYGTAGGPAPAYATGHQHGAYKS